MNKSKSSVDRPQKAIFQEDLVEKPKEKNDDSAHRRHKSAGHLTSAWNGVTSFASSLVGSRSRDASSAPEHRKVPQDGEESSQQKGILQGVVSGVLNFLVPQQESMAEIEKKIEKTTNEESGQSSDMKEEEEDKPKDIDQQDERRRKWEELRDTDWWDPSEGRSLTAIERVEHAGMFVEDCIAGDESIERAKWMRKIHRFRKSVYWSRFTLLIIIGHMIIGWFEPESIRNLSNVPLFTIKILQWIELFFVVVEWTDMILNYLQMGPGYFWHNTYETFTLLVNILLLTDLSLAMSLDSMSMIRWSRPIRPFLLFARTKVLRSSLNAMFATLKALSSYALYLVVMILLYTIVGVNLFWGVYRDDVTNQELMVEGNFDNSYKGLISMFVLITTANYPFVMYPSFAVLGPWASVFFVSFLLLAFYLTLTVLIAAVFSNYKEARQRNVVAERTRERRGLAAAFQYLDFDDSQDISKDIFEALIFMLYPKMEIWKVDLLFEICDLNGDGRLDILEFFDLSDALFITMEEIWAIEQTNGEEKGDVSRLRMCCSQFGSILRKIGESVWLDRIGATFVSLYTIIQCTFNLVPYNLAHILYYITFALSWLILAEVALRVIAIGVSSFTKNSWYRFDLILACISSASHLLLIGLGPSYISMLGAAGGVTIPIDQQWLSRLLSALSTIVSLRILSQVRMFRELISRLLGILPTMLSVFITISAFLYFFAIIGMWLFAGDFGGLNIEQYSNPQANFDSITAALITLFQMLTLANWHLTMYAAVISKGWWAAIYFVVFVSVVVIIFLNLIMALVIELFLSHGVGSNKKSEGTVIELEEDIVGITPTAKKDVELDTIREKREDSITEISEQNRPRSDSLSIAVPESSGDKPLLESPVSPRKRIRRILIHKHRKPWERDFPDVDSMFKEELFTLSTLMRIPNLVECKRLKEEIRWERRNALESEEASRAHKLTCMLRDVFVDPAQTQQLQNFAIDSRQATSKFDMDLFKATSMKISGARTYRQKREGSTVELVTRETKLRSDSVIGGATRLFKKKMNKMKRGDEGKV